MDNTPESKSITEEIVDGLAKNYSELEKKYSELEKRQAKNESLNDTVKSLVPKVKALETSNYEYPKVYIPDYSKDFAQIQEQSKQLMQAYSQAVQHLEGKIQAMPKVIPVKNYHDFDPRSKPVVRLLIVMVITIAVLSGVSVGLIIKYVTRADDSNKFLITRGFYPDIAKAIDDAYIRDADKLIKIAEANIQKQQTKPNTAKKQAEAKAAGEGKNKQTRSKSERSNKH